MPSFDRGTRGRARDLRAPFSSPWRSACSLAASASAAAPNWLEPADLSKPGRDASNPQVAMDAAGNTLAVWERQSTARPELQHCRCRRARTGGTFTAPVDLVAEGHRTAAGDDSRTAKRWRPGSASQTRPAST